MKRYIKPECEAIIMEPLMADDGDLPVLTGSFKGDSWTFTEQGSFDEEEGNDPSKNLNTNLWEE